MATPMTADQALTQLKKWGIKYVEIPGWKTHNRNSKGPWGPVNGFIWHHTGATVAASNAKSYAASTLYNGLATLPGPLCQFSIGADGIVYLVGWGRANHAGGGDPAVLQHVINEDYTGQLKPTRGNSNGTDGNAHFYGVEIQYSGSKPMADVQYKAALKLSAAILDFHGWTEKSVIGHGEWSNDKWDPGYASNKIMAMPTVRADVKTTRAAGPGGAVQPSPSKPPAKEDTGMPTAAEIAAAVMEYQIDDPRTEGTKYVPAKSVLWWAGADAAQANSKVRDLEAQVQNLTTLVERLVAANIQGK